MFCRVTLIKLRLLFFCLFYYTHTHLGCLPILLVLNAPLRVELLGHHSCHCLQVLMKPHTHMGDIGCSLACFGEAAWHRFTHNACLTPVPLSLPWLRLSKPPRHAPCPCPPICLPRSSKWFGSSMPQFFICHVTSTLGTAQTPHHSNACLPRRIIIVCYH